MHLLDAGHFALETHGPEIFVLIRDFLDRHSARLLGGQAARPRADSPGPSLKLDLRAEPHDELTQVYRDLRAWPDVQPALRSLREAGLSLAFVSDFSAEMLDAAVAQVRLAGHTGSVSSSLRRDQHVSFV